MDPSLISLLRHLSSPHLLAAPRPGARPKTLAQLAALPQAPPANEVLQALLSHCSQLRLLPEGIQMQLLNGADMPLTFKQVPQHSLSVVQSLLLVLQQWLLKQPQQGRVHQLRHLAALISPVLLPIASSLGHEGAATLVCTVLLSNAQEFFKTQQKAPPSVTAAPQPPPQQPVIVDPKQPFQPSMQHAPCKPRSNISAAATGVTKVAGWQVLALCKQVEGGRSCSSNAQEAATVSAAQIHAVANNHTIHTSTSSSDQNDDEMLGGMEHLHSMVAECVTSSLFVGDDDDSDMPHAEHDVLCSSSSTDMWPHMLCSATSEAASDISDISSSCELYTSLGSGANVGSTQVACTLMLGNVHDANYKALSMWGSAACSQQLPMQSEAVYVYDLDGPTRMTC